MRRRAFGAALAATAAGLAAPRPAAPWATPGASATPATPVTPATPARGETARGGAPHLAGPDEFAFALIGDVPYGRDQVALLPALLADLDDALAFAIHVGDLKGGLESCSDAVLAQRHAALAASRVPILFTPGDNEWLDCSRLPAGGFDPLGRLERLRSLFFEPPRAPRGVSDLVRQSDAPGHRPFPENLRWHVGETVFVTVNLPGSDNGREGAPAMQAHHALRADANEAWLREASGLAARAARPLLVIAVHADPGFEREDGAHLAAPPPDGYTRHRALLRELAGTFPGQVLYLHGDTHRFRVDRPLRDTRGARLRNFTRVESFGSPFASSWVRVRVRPADPSPFFVAVRHAPPARP